VRFQNQPAPAKPATPSNANTTSLICFRRLCSVRNLWADLKLPLLRSRPLRIAVGSTHIVATQVVYQTSG
jgi:hypothetical protein